MSGGRSYWLFRDAVPLELDSSLSPGVPMDQPRGKASGRADSSPVLPEDPESLQPSAQPARWRGRSILRLELGDACGGCAQLADHLAVVVVEEVVTVRERRYRGREGVDRRARATGYQDVVERRGKRVRRVRRIVLRGLEELAGTRGRLGCDHRVEGRPLPVPRDLGKMARDEASQLLAVELLHVELVLVVALVAVLDLVGAREHEDAAG